MNLVYLKKQVDKIFDFFFENRPPPSHLEGILDPPMMLVRGGSRILSRGFDIFFLFILNDLFSELSQSTKKPLFWPKFLCRRFNFEKTDQNSVLRLFLEDFFVFSTRAPP